MAVIGIRKVVTKIISKSHGLAAGLTCQICNGVIYKKIKKHPVGNNKGCIIAEKI
jgi:hypothetical protein